MPEVDAGANTLKSRRQRAGVSERRLAKCAVMKRAWVQWIEGQAILADLFDDVGLYLAALEACAKEPKPKRGRPKKGEEP